MNVQIQFMHVPQEIKWNSLAFFSFSIGTGEGDAYVPIVSFRECKLMRTKAGTKYYIKFPAKQRMKGGEPVVDEKTGFNIWDDYYDLGQAKKDDGNWAPTKAAFQFKDDLLQAAITKFETLNKGSGLGADTGGGGSSQPQAEIAGEDVASPTGGTKDVLPF
jgi:hypothetical protein